MRWNIVPLAEAGQAAGPADFEDVVVVSSVAPLDSSQAVFGFWRRFVRIGVAVCPSGSTKLPALAAVVAAVMFGAIAIIYNVAGLDSLVVDAPTAAKIFNGAIRRWDAPEITALNPGRLLPASPIVVVSRSDESGTTENFQTYLAAAAGPAWGKGGGETFNGAKGVSAVGNEGAWAAMRQYAGSITYVAWPFAKKNGLPTASIVTSAGSEPVALSVESVSKSVDGVTIAPRGNNLVVDPASFYTPARSGAYPIVMTTYEAVCSAYPDPQTSAAVKTFLIIAVAGAQQDLVDSGYVPVPDSVKDRLSTAINAIS